MEVTIVQSSTSSMVEQSSGSKVQKTNLEVQFEIEQRRNLKKKSNMQKAELLRPYLLQLGTLAQAKDIQGLKSFFVQWASQIGFKTQKISNICEDKLYSNYRWQTFAKVVYNYYLSLFDDCNKQQRGLKFKRTKYQFETKPESEDAYNQILVVDWLVDSFIESRGDNK
jgi:hypothetical protein